MPIEDLESWEETLDIMSNKKLMADLRQSEKERKDGKTFPLKNVLKELGIHGD